MAGLSAAWHLDKRGFRDFVLLEMEPHAGGNSRWGENEISRFPWAAHYVPVPAKGESLVRELFEELGVCETASGMNASCASRRRSGCSFTAAGRRASSRRTLRRATATITAASTIA